MIYPPTYGRVEKVWWDDRDRLHVLIYIAPTDEHTIHAPVTGELVNMKTEAMDAVRRGFRAVEHKRGRLKMQFSGGIQVSIEVGEGYITDLISLAPDVESVPMPVTAGQWLGTIVLGSRSEIVIPHSRIPALGFDAVREPEFIPNKKKVKKKIFKYFFYKKKDAVCVQISHSRGKGL